MGKGDQVTVYDRPLKSALIALDREMAAYGIEQLTYAGMAGQIRITRNIPTLEKELGRVGAMMGQGLTARG